MIPGCVKPCLLMDCPWQSWRLLWLGSQTNQAFDPVQNSSYDIRNMCHSVSIPQTTSATLLEVRWYFHKAKRSKIKRHHTKRPAIASCNSALFAQKTPEHSKCNRNGYLWTKKQKHNPQKGTTKESTVYFTTLYKTGLTKFNTELIKKTKHPKQHRSWNKARLTKMQTMWQ